MLHVLRHMKVEKSLGIDQLYLRTLWEARKEILGALAEIYASLLAIDGVPGDWMAANFVPLFRKGFKKRPGGYGSISLICGRHY